MGKCSLCRTFPADVALIGPHVTPIPVSAAIANTNVIKISVDSFQRNLAIEIEDDIGVADHCRMARQDFVLFAQNTHSNEVGDGLVDENLG